MASKKVLKFQSTRSFPKHDSNVYHNNDRYHVNNMVNQRCQFIMKVMGDFGKAFKSIAALTVYCNKELNGEPFTVNHISHCIDKLRLVDAVRKGSLMLTTQGKRNYDAAAKVWLNNPSTKGKKV